MSQKSSVSVRLAAANSGDIYAQMMAGVSRPISVREIVIVTRTAVATEIALARSSSVGTASAGNVATGIAHRPVAQALSVGRVELGWATAPSGPTGAHPYLRREVIGAATGTRIRLWTENETPLSIEPTGATGMGLLLLNVGSAPGAALDVHFTWEHGPASDT